MHLFLNGSDMTTAIMPEAGLKSTQQRELVSFCYWSVRQQNVKLTSRPLQLLLQGLALEPQEAAHQDRDHQEQQQHNRPWMIRGASQNVALTVFVLTSI